MLVPKTIIVVGCGKLKLDRAAPAAELYVGPLFKAARAYAEANSDAWCIMSALYGILEPDRVVEPYNVSFQSLDKITRGDRARMIRHQFQASPYCRHVQRVADPTTRRGFREISPRVVVLAGEDYVDALAEYKPETPLRGLGIGERLRWFKERRLEAAAVATLAGESSAA